MPDRDTTIGPFPRCAERDERGRVLSPSGRLAERTRVESGLVLAAVIGSVIAFGAWLITDVANIPVPIVRALLLTDIAITSTALAALLRRRHILNAEVRSHGFADIDSYLRWAQP